MCRGLTIVIVGVVAMALFGQMAITSAGSLPSMSENARLMRPITAMITFADGSTEVKHGQGFVVGKRLFTVYHTLAPRMKNAAPIKREIYVAGVLMTPVYTHSTHDVAIFEMPDALCEPHCNVLAVESVPALRPGPQVYWMQEAEGQHVVIEGRIQHYAWLSESPPGLNLEGEARCQRNLIVEVDTPFRPGTSGSPVFDARTNAIVGMIQGSLIRASGDTGYFKPLTCLLSLAQL